MKTLNISDVRNHLPSVIEDVAQSNQAVVVTRYGKPIASIEPVKNKKSHETRYPLRGQSIMVAEDFDKPTPEMWRALAVANVSRRSPAPPEGAKTEECGQYVVGQRRRPGKSKRSEKK